MTFSDYDERGVACAVVSSGIAALDAIGHQLRPEHLFTFKYRQLYLAAFDLYALGTDISLSTLTSQLHQNGDLEKVGGTAFVSELANEGGNAHTARFCADKVLAQHRLRKAGEVIAWATSALDSPDDTFLPTLQSKIASLDDASPQLNLLAPACASINAELSRHEAGEHTMGLPTGIPSWDYALGGLAPGRLYALAARPGKGKTALAEQLSDTLLTNGHPVLFFSKDMSAEMLLKRMACRCAGVPFVSYEHGNFLNSQLSAIRHHINLLSKTPFHILSPRNLTGENLRSIVRTYSRKHGVKAVILDHVQLLDTGHDIREGLTKASIQIRLSTTETQIPHIILAHLNRNALDCQRPKPSDIKEFDQLFGDCDALILLWSDQAQFQNSRLPVKFTVAKNRYGPVCEHSMTFHGPTMRFEP